MEREENVLWKAQVPGRGHASPTVCGDKIFLATADEAQEVQSVLCYDRASGRNLWKVDVHTAGMDHHGHKKSSQASATVACDGERVFANFVHDGGVYTTALDLAGRQVWQTRVSEFVTHQGFGSSPTIYQSSVLVATDNKAGGVIAALDRRSGKVLWKQDRPKQPNYTSPVVLTVDGRDQLLLAGCDHVASFDPLSGKPLWEIEGSTTECVGSIVTDGQLVFASGGYPKKLTVAVRADGSGEVVWENTTQTYVPSMVVHERLPLYRHRRGDRLLLEIEHGRGAVENPTGWHVQHFAGAGWRAAVRDRSGREDVDLQSQPGRVRADR